MCAILARASAWTRRWRVKTAKTSRTARCLVYRQDGNIFPGHFLQPTSWHFYAHFYAPHPSWTPVFLTSEMINTSCIFQLLFWLFPQDRCTALAWISFGLTRNPRRSCNSPTDERFNVRCSPERCSSNGQTQPPGFSQTNVTSRLWNNRQ